MSDTNPLQGLYRVTGTLGNVGTPGAPICHFDLLVYPSGHSVTGVVHITQAIAGPQSDITVQVRGKIYATGLGHVTQVVSLAGQYTVSVPPPAIGTYLAHFEAHMAIDASWNGKGGFEYNGHDVEDVPVTKAN